MKSLKLILIFLVVLGVVVGAFLLIDGGGSASIKVNADASYEEYRQQIARSWEELGDWDEANYAKQCNLVKQLQDEYEVEATNILALQNSQTALEIVHKKIFEEWDKADCQESVVRKYNEAKNTIRASHAAIGNDPNLTSIESVYATYCSALSLSKDKCTLSTGFNGTSWNNFSAHHTKKIKARNEMLANSNYKTYLSHISSIKQGLNSFESKLATAKVDFYNKLANSIKSHYHGKERTYENKRLLSNAISKYERESNNSEKKRELRRFEAQFENEVEQALGL